MSAIGIDFGSQKSVVGVVRRGGIDIVANEVSSRSTPSVVGFGPKERFLGEAALTQYITNFKNTITQMKLFLGRKFNEPGVQQELAQSFPSVKTKSMTNGDIGFEVYYNNENITFTPTQLTAMLIHKLVTTSERETGTKVSEVVLGAPVYYTDAQRRALIDAAEIAGVKCLKILNEPVASALGYGFYRLDLPDKDKDPPLILLFIDVGHSVSQVSVIAFNKDSLKVLGSAFDKTLGGASYDKILVDRFAAEIKERYKLDVLGNPRAKIRLESQSERVKKVLSSGVPEAVLNIEALMNDVDVSCRITTQDYENAIRPLLERQVTLVQSALEEAGVTVDHVAYVEITGAGRRISAIHKILSESLKKEVKQTLNDTECVAKGCALQAAMLSPTHRVRQFSVTDASLYPIKLSWNTLGEDSMQIDSDKSPNSAEVFPKFSPFPSAKAKLMTFHKTNPFEVLVSYADTPHIHESSRAIGKYTFPSIPTPTEGSESPRVKIKFKINHNGIFVLDSAEFSETIEVEVPPSPPATPTPTPASGSAPPPSTPPSSTDTTSSNSESNSGSTPQSQAANSPTDTPAPDVTMTPSENKEEKPPSTPDSTSTTESKQPDSGPKKKKKVKHQSVSFKYAISTLEKAEIQSFHEKELHMQAQDKLAVETADAKNAVESYVLDMRARLAGDLFEYSTEGEREAFSRLLNETEEWLYDEGDETTKSVYQEKLKLLKSQGDPIVNRKQEDLNRTKSYQELKTVGQQYTNSMSESKYDHIEPEEKVKLSNEVQTVLKTVGDLISQQEALPKTATPVIRAWDIDTKKNELDKFCKAILNKPKPAPPPPTPAPAPTTPPQAPPSGSTSEEQTNQPQTPTDKDIPMHDVDSGKTENQETKPPEKP